jgi:lipopolysaccharide/colanic/teichoic acid biosynthesis glycosyltransferase
LYPSDVEMPEQHREEVMASAKTISAQPIVHPMELLFVKRLSFSKRAIDILCAAVGLVVMSPVILLSALAIKLTSRGPVFFMQQRNSVGGRPFLIYKLRTMHPDAERRKSLLRAFSEQDGPAFKMKKDPRVTTVGRFLRSTSIDELPQLWNVLIGDMTLVGPRPLPRDETNRCHRWQRRRLDVMPGLTCIWQVRGRSTVSFAEWMRMDLQYIRTHSLAHDLKLLFQTIPAVVLRRGAC